MGGSSTLPPKPKKSQAEKRKDDLSIPDFIQKIIEEEGGDEWEDDSDPKNFNSAIDDIENKNLFIMQQINEMEQNYDDRALEFKEIKKKYEAEVNKLQSKLDETTN